MEYTVHSIKTYETHDWFLNKHYAKRIPSISYAFGLFDKEGIMQGVCTFGTPASSTLLRGVCGDKYASIVKELNRLVTNELPKNATSFFLGQCFKMLPKPLIIVSYADTSQGHNGYIYQATNFIYTGLSSKFKDPMVHGLEHQHHATYANGMSNEQLREKFGDRLYFVDRAQKHRYVIMIGSKKQKSHLLKNLKYDIKPYPKGVNDKYDASFSPQVQLRIF